MKLFQWSCHRVMSSGHVCKQCSMPVSWLPVHACIYQIAVSCMLNSQKSRPTVVETCPRAPAFLQLLRTSRHLVLGRCCSALGWSGRSTDDEGRYLQHQDQFHKYFGLCKYSRITCVFDQPPLICDLQPVVRPRVCIHVVRCVSLFPRRSRASLPLQGCSQAQEFRQI